MPSTRHTSSQTRAQALPAASEQVEPRIGSNGAQYDWNPETKDFYKRSRARRAAVEQRKREGTNKMPSDRIQDGRYSESTQALDVLRRKAEITGDIYRQRSIYPGNYQDPPAQMQDGGYSESTQVMDILRRKAEIPKSSYGQKSEYPGNHRDLPASARKALKEVWDSSSSEIGLFDEATARDDALERFKRKEFGDDVYILVNEAEEYDLAGGDPWSSTRGRPHPSMLEWREWRDKRSYCFDRRNAECQR